MSNYNASSSSSKSISDGSDVKNYGGVDNDKDIPGGCAKRNPTKEEIHDHWMSTLALCSSVFSMFYLVFSIFPYGGFMALQLVPGLKYNSVGTYAGILTGSMKIASVFTAYPWGIISDTYGRKFVLLFSTASSAVLMLAFGFSTNFAYAVAIRILIGLCKCVCVCVSRVWKFVDISVFFVCLKYITSSQLTSPIHSITLPHSKRYDDHRSGICSE
ncbi:MAG: nitrate/nitrite transporter NarK [Bacillariaceae sp.]|jgi:nitrate/nitrite transporter NarK